MAKLHFGDVFGDTFGDRFALLIRFSGRQSPNRLALACIDIAKDALGPVGPPLPPRARKWGSMVRRSENLASFLVQVSSEFWKFRDHK